MTVSKCQMCGSAELRLVTGFAPFEFNGRSCRYPTRSVLCGECDSITTLPEQQQFNAESLARARRFVATHAQTGQHPAFPAGQPVPG
ncbi:MAG TPA: hypothetical protein VHE37_05625 [Nevskiaceae bacterium]|nr:hypothetical protein [Nevskiaceae bacterium]